MQIEVKTRLKIARDGTPVVIMDVLLLPRGSGNRNRARRLGEAFRQHPKIKKHIRKIVVGASRITVHMRSSIALMRDINQISPELEATQDVEGQLKLFGAV